MTAYRPPSSDIDRRTVVAAFAALVAGAAARSAQAAAPLAVRMKFMSLLVPKAGIEPAEFRRQWLDVHARQALGIPNMDGFVLSEAVPPLPGEGMAAMPALPEIVGVSTSWWNDTATRDAARETPEMKAWVAHGNTILDRPRCLSLTLNEHVFVRPQITGTVKRIGLMRRKPGTTHEACIDWWLKVHVPMADAVPRLRGFVVSEVVGGSSEIDGVVETWWDSLADREASLATPGGVAWNADGRLFLDIPASRGVFTRDRAIIPPPAWISQA